MKIEIEEETLKDLLRLGKGKIKALQASYDESVAGLYAYPAFWVWERRRLEIFVAHAEEILKAKEDSDED